MTTASVRFNLKDNLYVSDSKDEDEWEDYIYLLDEVHYTREDYERMRRQNKLLVEQLEAVMNGSSLPQRHQHHPHGQTTYYYFRGLEHRTKQGARKRKNNISRARDVVLEEQERQRQSNINNPGLIAELYKGYCIPSASNARKVGLQDAQQIRDIVGKVERADQGKGGKEEDDDEEMSIVLSQTILSQYHMARWSSTTTTTTRRRQQRTIQQSNVLPKAPTTTASRT